MFPILARLCGDMMETRSVTKPCLSERAELLLRRGDLQLVL